MAVKVAGVSEEADPRPPWTTADLEQLEDRFSGELRSDRGSRLLYATDASAYREIPLLVALPKDKRDVEALIEFARAHRSHLIPRAAGTSLGGQVVGKGIVVDVSKYMNRIIDFDPEARWVLVEPGVVRDDLNRFLAEHGLMFAPETSTANRCGIGGMVGNNSCGVHSLVYGSTRDHVTDIRGYLSDGAEVVFGDLWPGVMEEKGEAPGIEGQIYRWMYETFHNPTIAQKIREAYPADGIRRRNTGYALDQILACSPFTEGGPLPNLCKLICGSEGTLMFVTEIRLNLVPLPPPERAVMLVHLENLKKAAWATILSRTFEPDAIELIDRTILDCAKDNPEQERNRRLVKGDPTAIIAVEFNRETREEVETLTSELARRLEAVDCGYAFPVLWGDEVNRIWSLRRAGLGVLANLVGDSKAVPCIEDAAVKTEDLATFFDAIERMMERHRVDFVSYAHIGDGEIHFRPILNLKHGPDRKKYRDITQDMVRVVKRFRGSLSGEHGDGRVRGEFLKQFYGHDVYNLLLETKRTWDPKGIFNPNKIVDAPPMNTSLRYEENQEDRKIETVFDYSETGGILRLAEKCNGSGDCRKGVKAGGVMCPSYMATKDERDTTRGRANILREFLTRSTGQNPFDHEEIREAMDLCLSCKGCLSECPSTVDVARMKAEFLHQYAKVHGIPRRSRLVARFAIHARMASGMAPLANWMTQKTPLGRLIQASMGFSSRRPLPALSEKKTTRLIRERLRRQNSFNQGDRGKIVFFADEFINFQDSEVGYEFVVLAQALGYQVELAPCLESGRAALSKGVLDHALAVASSNVERLAPLVSAEKPLIGLEPSAILGFRDEYPRLVRANLRSKAGTLAKHTFTAEEWLDKVLLDWSAEERTKFFGTPYGAVVYHGHCHQKALSSVDPTLRLLRYVFDEVKLIPSGCCGMAGSFGYEAEHADLSLEIAELALFPFLREVGEHVEVAASGISCREQIQFGVERPKTPKHPVRYLYRAYNEAKNGF